MSAWNAWYHVTASTYGNWLPGDARGWREKGHKRHVPGDYRNPPPEAFGAGLLRYSKDQLKRSPVHLSKPQRIIAGRALVETLTALKVELLVLSLDAIHLHCLARFPSTNVRHWIGLGKKAASLRLTQHGLRGQVWARKCRPLPITDRAHQLNVYEYIRKHAGKGSWVWTFRDGLSWIENDSLV